MVLGWLVGVLGGGLWGGSQGGLRSDGLGRWEVLWVGQDLVMMRRGGVGGCSAEC